MEKDVFENWVPTQNVPNRLYCEGLHDDFEGLQILLKGEKDPSPILRITFEAPLVYRNTDEGNRLRTLHQSTSASSSLLSVRNSSFSDWFVEECSGIYDISEITHYVIFTADDFIDVLSNSEPEVEWL